jgi:hypothetical protein
MFLQSRTIARMLSAVGKWARNGATLSIPAIALNEEESMVPDFINACFLFTAAICCIFSIVKISKDKTIKGVSILQILHLWAWTTWGVFFYAYYQIYLSFWCSLILTITETIWVAQIFYYRERNIPPWRPT